MANNTITDLTKLDFTEIRSNLKQYLENQNEFTDYDFDGSGISVLLDILAYNTQYNALLAHMNMNESFLETAQVRSNVVSHAQLIGYVPQSTLSSKADLDIVVQGNANSPSSVSIPKGFAFTGKINNKQYSFVTLTSYTAFKLSDNSYKFYNVSVYQGALKTQTYRFDGLDPFAKFEIPSDNVDMTTAKVDVYENANTGVYSTYVSYANINDVTPTTEVFFYKENPFGRYDIYFGDGYLGVKPQSGAKIVVEYLDTDGSDANNIIKLTPGSAIGGLTNTTVTYANGLTRTAGGKDRETIESIRFNAPVSYTTQDRAVTANDYRVLILQNFSEVQDVSVWGGEDADPPQYGKVFVAPALVNQERSTETFRDAIASFLKGKNLGAITPEIVEAQYTNIAMEVDFKYNNDRTTKTVGELESIVNNAVLEYNNLYLNRFEGILRMSKLLTLIDNADPGILNSVIRTTMFKEFRPNPLISSDYTIKFPNRLYISSTNEPTVYSSNFTIEGNDVRIADESLTGQEPLRRLYLLNVNTGEKLESYTNIGYANPTTGNVYIQDIKFDTSNKIKIYAKPDSFDIAPKYDQLITISPDELVITSELDTVSKLGSTGLSSYNTFSRH